VPDHGERSQGDRHHQEAAGDVDHRREVAAAAAGGGGDAGADHGGEGDGDQHRGAGAARDSPDEQGAAARPGLRERPGREQERRDQADEREPGEGRSGPLVRAPQGLAKSLRTHIRSVQFPNQGPISSVVGCRFSAAETPLASNTTRL